MNEDETLADIIANYTGGDIEGLARYIEASDWLAGVIRQAKAEALEHDRLIAERAWDEGWDAHVQHMRAPYVWPIAKTHENPYKEENQS